VINRLKENPIALAGGAIVASMMLVSLLAPVISPYNPYAIDPKQVLQAPSVHHLLGTDHLGRDLLSRMIYERRYL